MIKLEVEPYCQNCRSFNPVEISHESMVLGEQGRVQISVKCENADICTGLYEHLKREFTKQEGPGWKQN